MIKIFPEFEIDVRSCTWVTSIYVNLSSAVSLKCDTSV